MCAASHTFGNSYVFWGVRNAKRLRRGGDGTFRNTTTFISGGHGIRTHNPLRGT